MKSFSQAGQDLFVYNILGRKKNGTYLDVGCGCCIDIFTGKNNGSNTLLLYNLGWRGIGFDIDTNFKRIWNINRNDDIYIEDLTIVNWENIIDENKILKNTIDYLSFDIDDATIPGIKNFPFDKIRFRVITIEHDSYRVGNETKNELRKILKENGYELLCSDVKVQIDGYQPWIYEDWWVDMNEINKELAELFRSDKELGHVIANKGNEYLDKVSNSLNLYAKIDISLGEAIDRMSILNIKKLYINDNEKLLDINNELKNYNDIINTIIKHNFIDDYKNIYIINKKIWKLSNIIREKNNNDEYQKALIEIHKYNDDRFLIKNKVNQKINSFLKEHKSYKNITYNEKTYENNIYYVSSGKLGDFFNTLYIIKNIYENTGKKGVLYITNFNFFTFSIERTYYELLDIVLEQEYIEDFILNNSYTLENFKNDFKNDFINLTEFYKSPFLYNFNWIDIFTKQHNLESISNPINWLKINKINDKFKDKILIHSKNEELLCDTLYQCINKNKCIFITCNKKEYNNFPYKDILESYYICEDLNEMLIAINSCKFFIGSQSSPLACAVAMGKNCLCKLYNIVDKIHYMGMESYNPNFYWVVTDNFHSPNFDSIRNHINF